MTVSSFFGLLESVMFDHLSWFSYRAVHTSLVVLLYVRSGLGCKCFVFFCFCERAGDMFESGEPDR